MVKLLLRMEAMLLVNKNEGTRMYTELLKKIWSDVYNPQMDAEEVIKKYFHLFSF